MSGLERSDRKCKSRDIGYALAASSCEGVNSVEACTVTASDVTTAFAAFNPNPLLAKVVGFFGSKRSANHFTETITQSTSDRQRFNETNPFDRRHKPDIGYALSACSCEGAGSVDACTVPACHVIIAFAISGPGLLLAELAGFFGSERPANRFTGRSPSLLRISRCLFQLPFQLSTRVILNQDKEMSTPKTCANNKIFASDEGLMETA